MGKWEDMLTFLSSSSDQATPTRESVVDDSKKWVKSALEKAKSGKLDSEVLNAWRGAEEAGSHFDVWVSWNFTMTLGSNTQHGSYTIGTSYDVDAVEGPDSKIQKFLDGAAVMTRMFNLPEDKRINDRLDIPGFATVADDIKNLKEYVAKLAPQVSGWAKEIDEPGSNWQGSAAGAFRGLLLAFGNEVERFHRELESDVEQSLRTCTPGLNAALMYMNYGWTDYLNSRNRWGGFALTKALVDGLAGASVKIEKATVTGATEFHDGANPGQTYADVNSFPSGWSAKSFTYTVTGAAFGDPKTVAFWEKVDHEARVIWQNNVVDILDVQANNAQIIVGGQYDRAKILLDAHVSDLALRMPMPAPPSTDDPTKDGPGGDGPKTDTPDIKTDDITGGGGGGAGGGGGSGPDIKDITGGPGTKDLGLNGDKTGDNWNLTGNGGGSGTSGGGGTGSNGGLDLIGGGAGGNSLLGDNSLLGGGGSNRPVTVPPGSVITKDGRIVDENGNPVLDSNGNPMVAGPNYTIGPDGTLRDDKGNTVSEYRQLLADRYSGDGGDGLLTPGNFGPGGFAYNTGGLGGGLSGSGSGPLTPGGGPVITGMGGGLSSRALAGGADPNTMKAAVDQANAERMAAEKAAKAAAQEQALLTGRQTPTSSSGMPPMMPPGGMGAGGQGGANDKDRRRTTWLAEDEETWGTETGAVHGVIGR
ncbi:hypothetical protein [Kitasatospora sp. NPDC091207]|uniref:hypothetical protein n=1 Tax=Kitasatospora sp. NPDC091207 TaxID=3364083 RepID=UPI00380A86CA